MDGSDPGRVTGLLKAWVNGDAGAQSDLIPLVYDELRRLARYYRRKGNAGNTIQTTALVHEAYMRLVRIDEVSWHDRTHFFAVAAQLMRRILVDMARARAASKRGGGDGVFRDIALDEIAAPDSSADIVALHDALSELAQLDPRRAQVVELRVFGGLTHEEAGDVLGISPQSAMRDWRLAKAWIVRELKGHTRP